tara:strand:- start:373 stop:1263 length:891 start_codon:yes stop_codon:yes gene_type:complete
MGLIDLNPRLNFLRLIQRIQPTSGEVEAAISHVSSTRTRLEKSFNLRKFQRIGSHARSSAIKSYSDLDFLAVLARNEAKWAGNVISSDTVIKRISNDLSSRFTSTTIRKDMQAVVLNFSRGQKSMDVVPAFFHSFNRGRPIYKIPDGYGGWMETSPESHNSFINKQNERSAEKLRRVGQLLRYWKYSRLSGIPISSFYIDLLLAQSEICIGVKSYPSIVYDFFKLMSERQCRGLEDPVNIAGIVYAVKTEAQGNKLRAIIENSLEHATKALIAEKDSRFSEANRQWNIVFNQSFLN